MSFEWKVQEPGIESSGICIESLVNAFGPFKRHVSKWLVLEGIGKLNQQQIVEFDVTKWYPVQAELNALKRTYDEVGKEAVYQAGIRTIEFSAIPPMNDIVEAMYSLNIAYHMNHRKNGIVMFDPAKGEILTGIGDFVVEKADLKNREIIIAAPGPFPCVYNRGIIQGLAQKFEKMATVKLMDSDITISKGFPFSRYKVQW